MPADQSQSSGYPARIAAFGMSIYDPLRESPEHFLSILDLEAILREGLAGLSLDFPLRTRSKVLKSRICELLGYPVPGAFKKSKPRFPGQDFDTYIQKSDNLQIWNDQITPTRRYVLIRLNNLSQVTGVRVVTSELLARLDRTGTLTKKYQAKSREPVVGSCLVSQLDAYSVPEAVAAFVQTTGAAQKPLARVPDMKEFLPVKTLYAKLLPLL